MGISFLGERVGGGSSAGGIDLSQLTTLTPGTDNLTIAPDGTISVNEVYYGGSDPARNGLLGWTMPPIAGAGVAQTFTSGAVTVFKCWAHKDLIISRLWINVDAVQASGVSGQNFAAVFSAAGAQLGITADQTTAWGSTGNKQMDLASSTPTIAKSSAFYLAILANATTALGIRRGPLVTAANLGLSGGANLLYGVAATGATAMPSTITPANIVAAGGVVCAIGYS